MALFTEHELTEALKELLPPLDPTTVTFSKVLEDLATQLGVDKSVLKTNHKEELKQMIPDMLHFCQGGDNKENESDNEEEDADDHQDKSPVKVKTPSRSRSRIVESEDDDEENEDSHESKSEASGDDSEEDDEPQPKRRKKATTATRKEKTTASKQAKRKSPPAKKQPADKPKDSEGMAALKELARVAGLLNPAVYTLLKRAESEAAQEEILRDRLHEGGIRFSGKYPKKSDLAAAKRQKEKERELDGIDTSLIITGGGRSRRGSSREPPSYVEKYDDNDDDEDEEQGDNDREDKRIGGVHEEHTEESEAQDGSESEAEF